MDNPAMFMEYSESANWIAIHFAQWFAALLLFGGFIGLFYALSAESGLGAGLVRFGLGAAVLWRPLSPPYKL